MTTENTLQSAPLSQPEGEVTLKQIARLAGVSIATVSRAINQPDMVAASKLKAVEEVLQRLSYIPNNAARILLNGRSMTIGLIVPTMSNPVFAPTIEAAEETLRAAGYGVLVACSNRDVDLELEQVRTMLGRGVDGLILTGSRRHPDVLGVLRSRNVPVVFQDCAETYPGSFSVAMPDASAMALAIDTLVDAGHRRIAVLTGPTGNTPPVAERLRGAREQLAARGIELSPLGLAETEDYDAATARAAVRCFLNQSPGYTAIACTGDILALGAIMAIREAGLSVPDDISIVGCSDSVMVQYVDPPLTTIHLPFKEMGAVAAERLLSILKDEPASGLTFMPFQLVRRQSIKVLSRDDKAGPPNVNRK
jgi:LacI family transcriptional regulator